MSLDYVKSLTANNEIVEAIYERIEQRLLNRLQEPSVPVELEYIVEEATIKTMYSSSTGTLGSCNLLSLGAVDLNKKTVPELKEMADSEDIDYKSNITKPELIEKLEG